MQLVAIVGALDVVTHLGAIAQAESGTSLLTDHNASGQLTRTVQSSKLIGIGVSLDGGGEGLSRQQRQVLDVVGVQVSGLCAGGRLGNGSQAVPSDTLIILTGILLRVQNTVINAGFIKMLGGFIPNNLSHVRYPP
nr:MAG TPA: hypothetical protein [Caudoviricetes sp.]